MNEANSAYWEAMLTNNVQHGKSTVVCTGKGKWTLPGGKILTNRRDAEKAAVKIHKMMGGE